jgi:hypothetical protein
LVGESGPKGYYLSAAFQEAIAGARCAAEDATRRRIDALESEAANLRRMLSIDREGQKSPLQKSIEGTP